MLTVYAKGGIYANLFVGYPRSKSAFSLYFNEKTRFPVPAVGLFDQEGNMNLGVEGTLVLKTYRI